MEGMSSCLQLGKVQVHSIDGRRNVISFARIAYSGPTERTRGRKFTFETFIIDRLNLGFG